MALYSFHRPDIDRIIDRDYEAYTDRLLDETYGDRGECCKYCEFFVESYGDLPSYCNRNNIDETDDDAEFERLANENHVDEDDCCEHYEYNISFDRPEDDY